MSAVNDRNDGLGAALPTFIAESRELLVSMEDSLMQLEQAPDNADAINATFRAIHTIKGSAGLFGLDDIVRFAHVVENVLDRARGNELAVDDKLSALLLECGDHLGTLVGIAAGEGADNDAEALAAAGAALLERLAQFSAVTTTSLPVPVATARPTATAAADGVTSDCWHLSLRFGTEVLKNGMDPASFLRYLSTLGELVSVVPIWDAMPDDEAMDPENCYLGFEIALRSEAERSVIESTFDFVRDDCRLRLLPPHGSLAEYRELLEAWPEGAQRGEELLLASGALNEAELARLHEPLAAAAEAALPAAGERGAKKERHGHEAKFVRVDAAKLEALINQVGEMVIVGASAALRARQAGDGLLQESMSMMGRLIEEIRDSALSLRMVEIGETFHRFRRVVRDVSRDLGKDIELVTSGDDTELDKMVVEKITDPLTHLVRNAMDHGIECAEVRRARGKPATAQVRLNAYHESGSIVIEVSDDGGGLNKEKLLAKGIERGLVAAGQNLSEKEIFNLIFEPGFSTADKVSNLSGRGVGMDVVRRNIEALRGSIDLESRETEGTTVRIRLPLTLAIIDGFLIEVGDSSFVVPLDFVVECMELPDADRYAGNRHYLNLRGEVLPFVRLRELFNLPGVAAERENVVIVSCGGQKAGLVVDRLLGEFQTVIKPLGSLFRYLRCISGSTILGTGAVALILDVAATVQHAVTQESSVIGSGDAAPLLALGETVE